MKKIEVEIGYREEYDNGEVRYYCDWSGQGYVYKDVDAFEKKEGVAYIREATFEHAKEDYDRDYVTIDQLEKEGDNYDYATMMKEVKWYFKGNENVDGKPWADKFYGNVLATVFDIVDWQGVDILLDELDWDTDIDHYDGRRFSVWVGGGEVNDYYLTEEEAERLADTYREDGYDDVQVVENN